ncbi:MAG: proline--tRNA ligase [Acidocella sp.]|nr:proline--tRNA ligase [Acidocella sp.]
MRLSQSLIPTLKETPAEAQIASHRLMLRAGLVRQMSSGIYAWLPAGLRVLARIEQIVREEQNAAGAQELLMPTIQSADLWRESGRYDAYGKEMLRITDRHDRELLFGPTNEEMITAILRDTTKSYRDLPQIPYHIQWKFRDEVRPRFGVLRGREFLMKDAYSFDLDYESALLSYKKMMLAYMRTFQRIGITAIPMRADTGQIGGDLSHEFHILAPTGESGVFYDADFKAGNALSVKYDEAALNQFYQSVTTKYAATDEKHDTEIWATIPDARKREGRGIEVGQIFYFGKKYSESMNYSVIGPDGGKIFPEMGSYGIGVSRLVGAIIEAQHDDAGIIWPDAIAPFRTAILNLRQGDGACDAICESLHAEFGDDCLYDNREERAGAKFAEADLMGHPWQIIVGPRGAAKGEVELKRRASAERFELPVAQAVAMVRG